MRCLICRVDTAEPAVRSANRIACGCDHSDRRLRENVLAYADHAHRLVSVQRIGVPGAHCEGAEVCASRATVEFCPSGDRNLSSSQQSNAATEEGDDIFAETEAKVEDVGAFQEERSLFREEEWKSREVRSPRVDFGFSEVRVDRKRGESISGDALIRV